MNRQVQQSGYSRVFLIEDGAGPQNVPTYLGLGRAGAMDWGLGDVTPQYIPDPDRYNQFLVDSLIRGEADLPSLSVESRKAAGELSQLLRIARKGCPVDIHIHSGDCENPRDFERGWTISAILEDAYPASIAISEQGAMGPDERAAVTETMPFSGLRYYEIKKLRPSVLAAAQVTDIINKVIYCDSATCGACGIASDGCQVAFALAGPVAGSPGLPAELLFTQDGGSTWETTNISTLALGEEPLDLACVGTNVVVISAASNSLHYAAIVDILAGEETWTEVDTGFVATKTPQRIISYASDKTYIVANGGYVYHTDDPTAGVDVQDEGGSSTENLADVDVWSNQYAAAVGANNVVLITANGGLSWSLVTGPAVGVDLTSVSMKGTGLIFVGTAAGRLYYTQNSGDTWTEIAFTGNGTGTVRDIQWSTKNVGYMAHDTAAGAGRVFRTINGGQTWTLMPEDRSVAVPVVASIRSIATCSEDPNVILVGGNSSGADGYLGKYN